LISNFFISKALEGNLKELLESIFIFEGRIDFLKNKHKDGIDSSHDSLAKHREPHDIIDHFATNADPSKKKIYTQKIVDWYKNKDFRQEDHGRVRQTLKDFEANKKKLPHSDIGKYKSFHHLNSALADFKPKQTNMAWGKFSQDDIDHLNTKGSTVVHDEPKYTVRKVHDQRAMDILGKGSEWCVVSNKHRGRPESSVGGDSSYFSRYKKDGDLFHVHDKETGERFLSHHPTKQYMGADDESRMQTLRNRYSAGLSKTLGGLRPKKIASSKFASKEQLHQLHDHPDEIVRREIAGNSNTAAHTLHALHRDEDSSVTGYVAQHLNTHADTLSLLSGHPNIFTRESVATHKNTRPDTLRKLATDKAIEVRMALAGNKNTDSETLDKLSDSNKHSAERLVRLNIAGHGNVSTRAQIKLSKDKEHSVVRELTNNIKTHPDVLHSLKDHSNQWVRRNVARHPNTRTDTLHHLSSDTDSYVKDAVASNNNSSQETLHALHTHDDPDTKLLVASNPNTSSDTLHKLSKLKHNRQIRYAVSLHKNTRPDTHQSMDKTDFKALSGRS